MKFYDWCSTVPKLAPAGRCYKPYCFARLDPAPSPSPLRHMTEQRSAACGRGQALGPPAPVAPGVMPLIWMSAPARPDANWLLRGLLAPMSRSTCSVMASAARGSVSAAVVRRTRASAVGVQGTRVLVNTHGCHVVSTAHVACLLLTRVLLQLRVHQQVPGTGTLLGVCMGRAVMRMVTAWHTVIRDGISCAAWLTASLDMQRHWYSPGCSMAATVLRRNPE